MDLQEAYKVLGVSENATDDEIENQYMKWVRRNNAYQSQPDTEKPFDIDVINEAYNTIKTYKTHGSESPHEFHSFREKAEHFFRYYKLHTLGVIILIVIGISIVNAVIDRQQEQKRLASLPPVNASIILYGDFFNPNMETEPISENVLAAFPSWERVPVNLNYFPVEINSSTDLGMQQKSAALLATELADVYIMDPVNFDRLMNTEMFLPLDQIDPSLKEKIGEDKLIFAKSEEDETEKLYGVEVTDETIFNGIQVSEDKKIAAVRINTENKDNAMKLILGLADGNE